MRPYNLVVHARVAQLAEQLIRNEQVIGSSPISGSAFFRGFNCRVVCAAKAQYPQGLRGAPMVRAQSK